MKEISAKEAYDRMQQSPDAVYLDVRSIPEFEQGHPAGAINIPLMNLVPGMGMTPNEDFTAVVQANIPPDTELIIGCKTGGRSARACQVLQGLGYQNVTNVRTGFVGAMDNMGRVVEPGWSMLNLPLCAGCEEKSQYEYLSKKTQKR